MESLTEEDQKSKYCEELRAQHEVIRQVRTLLEICVVVGILHLFSIRNFASYGSNNGSMLKPRL